MPELVATCTPFFRIPYYSIKQPMTFTSYAQNFEDVMLWRALKHVSAGKYIDIGAQDPVIDSVSKAFYELGWRGIHVEPVPQYAELLRRDRPDETVLQLALSDKAGVIEFNVFEDTGLSTVLTEFADKHRSALGLAQRVIQTPMLPIKTAFAALVGDVVHWMKIDVEGFEEAVLRGWDSQVLRPWVVVIEATIPLSRETRYQGADDILRSANYEFVYFDGLNRFYVAAEHPELKPAFSIPPNVFDEVRLSGSANSELCRGLLEKQLAETRAFEQRLETQRNEIREVEVSAQQRIARAEERAQRSAQAQTIAEARVQQLQLESLREAQASSVALHQSELQRNALQFRLDAVLTSTSWRVTAPLRANSTLFRRLSSAIREGRIKSGIKRRMKVVIRHLALAAGKSPMLRRSAATCLALFPPLQRRLRAALTPPADGESPSAEGLSGGSSASLRPFGIEDLSPTAAQIYAILSKAHGQKS